MGLLWPSVLLVLETWPGGSFVLDSYFFMTSPEAFFGNVLGTKRCTITIYTRDRDMIHYVKAIDSFVVVVVVT